MCIPTITSNASLHILVKLYGPVIMSYIFNSMCVNCPSCNPTQTFQHTGALGDLMNAGGIVVVVKFYLFFYSKAWIVDMRTTSCWRTFALRSCLTDAAWSFVVVPSNLARILRIIVFILNRCIFLDCGILLLYLSICHC